MGSRLARSVEHGLALGQALFKKNEETLERDDLGTCRLQIRDEGYRLLLA